MAKKRSIQTTTAAAVKLPFSQGMRAGEFIYTAGFGGVDPTTGQLVGETIEGQTAQALENIRAVLQASGADLSDVVKTTVHLSDLDLFERFNVVYAQYFTDPKPARTTVGSQLVMGMLVEIDVVAYAGEQ